MAETERTACPDRTLRFASEREVSRNGDLLAGGGADNTVRLWDVKTGKQLAWLPTQDVVLALWFSPDGEVLQVADAGAGTGRPNIRILRIVNGKLNPETP